MILSSLRGSYLNYVSLNSERFLGCLIFVAGMHEKQLYVQPSAQMQERMSEVSKKLPHDELPETCQKESRHLPRVAWKPYLNTGKKIYKVRV